MTRRIGPNRLPLEFSPPLRFLFSVLLLQARYNADSVRNGGAKHKLFLKKRQQLQFVPQMYLSLSSMTVESKRSVSSATLTKLVRHGRAQTTAVSMSTLQSAPFVGVSSMTLACFLVGPDTFL